MHRLHEVLQVAAAILVGWSALSVAVAFVLSALFRAQARRHDQLQRAERRRLWLETAR